MKRREFVTLLGGAAAGWPIVARAQQPVVIALLAWMISRVTVLCVGAAGGANMFTIRAVAVGSRASWDSSDPNENVPNNVRPYISGLVDWLDDQRKSHPSVQGGGIGRFRRGTGASDYLIEYREAAVDALANAFIGVTNNHLLFCMSTSVGDAAVEHLTSTGGTSPVVVISSEFENFPQNNVCVVSAERTQLIRECLTRFRRIAPAPGVEKVYALYRLNHYPSVVALRKIKRDVIEVAVADTVDPVQKVTDLQKAARGLLVLPADRFFAVASGIVAAAAPMPTYWTTPDWPPGLGGTSGAFGYSQYNCGRYMAERVAQIWTNGLPDPRRKDVTISQNEREEVPAR